ncbi:MAG: eukaryotic-like serine/threonine-protein kinase, partial [Pseudonocardiales bacterium]|nr:eukaryotic-like serine/threonine-protein kinase [Pseudonocardiales bacterium]
MAAASAVAGLFTARVLDADPDGDPPWLATEFVEGPSVRDAVLRNGPMPEPVLLDHARGLAEALGAIHAAGLVHRDLKPANVLLSPTGPRVIDFGIARAVDASRLTVTGQIIGTTDFMAPEQIEGVGESGAEVDVFALGSTLVWAATGRGPFAADQTAATLYRILSMPPDLDGVPPRVADLARACLAKDPARRPSAVQLAVRLRGSDPTGSRPDVHPWAADVAPQPAPTRGRRLVLGAGALVAVAVAG